MVDKEYLHFEETIRNTLHDERTVFDVNDFMDDIGLGRNKRKKYFWIWAIVFMAITCGVLNLGQAFLSESTIAKGIVAKGEPVDNRGLENQKALLKIDIDNSNDNVHSGSMFAEEKNDTDLTQSTKNSKTSRNEISKSQKSSDTWLDKNALKSKKSSELTTMLYEDKQKSTTTRLRPIVVEVNELARIKTTKILGAISSLEKHDRTNDIIPPNLSAIFNGPDCPEFGDGDANSGFEFIAEVGAFNPLKTLSVNSSEMNNLTALRQMNEKSLLGLCAGLNLKYNHNRTPLYLVSGLNYTKVVERMSLDFEVTEIDTTIGVVSVTESQAGDTITYIYGEIYSETTTTGNKTRHYKLNLIDIPLRIGYELELGQFSLGLETGVLLNLLLQSNGNLLLSESEFQDVSNAELFRNRIGLSMESRIGLAYKLNARHKVYLSTGFRYLPMEFNSTSNITTQKYRFIGLNLGYGFKF